MIGEEGYILGGAASDECDRYDLALGSPAQATILASATGFGPQYLMVPEDLGTPMPNSDGPNRPDMVRADKSSHPNIDINFRAVSQITLHAQPYRECVDRRVTRTWRRRLRRRASLLFGSFTRQRLDALKHQPSY